MPWTSLCELDELEEGRGKYVEIGGFQLAVFLHAGNVYAMDNTCPHAGAPMAAGWVDRDAGCAVCPRHGWAFRLDTGELKEAFNNDFQTGTSAASTNYTRGGKQLGLLASVVWIPEDWMRFYLQYSHAFVTGGPLADDVSGLSSSDPEVDNYDYGVDFIGTRAQIDF